MTTAQHPEQTKNLRLLDSLSNLRNDALASLVGETVDYPRRFKAEEKRRILREAARRLRWDDAFAARRTEGRTLESFR